MEEKLKIKFTPEIPPEIDKTKIDKSVLYIIMTHECLYYTLALDYPTTMFFEVGGEEKESEEFILKKYESGCVLRKDICGVTKVSYTIYDSDIKEARYTHTIIIDSPKTEMKLNCTWEEKNKYYPYIEDYYKGGDKWKELIKEDHG